ncbi:MAG: hypothetical protein AB1330_11665 [Bacillota bacterium]
MRRTGVILVVAAVICVGSALAGIWATREFAQAREDKTGQKPVPSQGIKFQTNERIKQLQAEYDRAVQEEMKSGTKEYNERLKTYFLTGKSKERIDSIAEELHEEIVKLQQRPPEQMAEVIKNIRALAENPNLEVKFNGAGGNPYTSTYRQWEEWRASNGFIYFVDPKTNRVCQVQQNPRPASLDELPKVSDKKLSEAEIRRIGFRWLEQHVPNFEWVKANYQFTSMSCEGFYKVYEYRWEAPQKPEGEEMKPFVQVSFAQDGTFLGFIDTRPLYGIE